MKTSTFYYISFIIRENENCKGLKDLLNILNFFIFEKLNFELFIKSTKLKFCSEFYYISKVGFIYCINVLLIIKR